jgi:hypothetical protein
MARRYAFLRFRAGVDWRDVNPTLLVRMNRLAMYLNEVITITSGARTPQGNTGAPHSHHVPQNNPSGKGEAVDAYVGDKPLGSVVSIRTAQRFGLFSGNRPGFYKGKPDPEHFETLERRGMKAPKGLPPDQQTAPPSAPPASSQQAGAPVDTSLPAMASAQPGAPPDPQESVPQPYAPGAVPADSRVGQDPVETWRLIASQPLASQDSQLFASRFGGGQ